MAGRWSNVAYDYSGASVLVTGATAGLGKAIAEAYREAGADVIITGTRGSPAEYDEDLAVTGRILSDEKVFVESLSVTLHGGTVPSLGKFRVVYANGVYEEWLSWEEVMASVVLGRYMVLYILFYLYFPRYNFVLY